MENQKILSWLKKLINKNKFPKHLYHYYSFNEIEDEKSGIKIKPYEDILIHNKLYFASPKDFNDPFDCSLYMKFSGSKKKVKKHLEKVILQPQVENIDNEIKKSFDDFVDVNWKQIDPNNPNNLDEMLNNQRMFIENSGIFCLTEKYDNILMWSHYSSKHSGFCVEYDFSKLNGDIVSFNIKNDLILHLESVKYSKNYPILSGYKDEDMIRALFTKSSDWKYEKEWRIFYFNGAKNKMPLSTTTVTSIYLGINIHDEKMEMVKELLRRRSSRINLFKGCKRNRKFSLLFNKIEY